MNYRDMDETRRQQIYQEVNSRAIELKAMLRNLTLSVGISLIFLNSGGVVLVLIYRYLIDGAATQNHTQISIFSFTFGIVATAIALMFLFMRTSKVESSYAVDRDLFLNSQLSIEELIINDGERYEGDNREYILILLSFVGFISGVLYGVFGFV